MRKQLVFFLASAERLANGWSQDGSTSFEGSILVNLDTTRGGDNGEVHDKIMSGGESTTFLLRHLLHREQRMLSFGREPWDPIIAPSEWMQTSSAFLLAM